MMRSHARMLGLLAIVALGCGKTLTPTEVMVTVDAEPGVRAQTQKLHIVVSGGSDNAGDRGAYDRTFSLDAGDLEWPHLTALAPIKDDASRVYELVASALDADGNLVAQVRAISGYRDHERLALRLLLEDSCIGKTCGSGLTCKKGGCVGAKIDAAKLVQFSDDVKPKASDAGRAANDGGVRSGGRDSGTDGSTGGSGGAGGSGGSGADGSMSGDPCDTNHGGCDPLVTCHSSGPAVTCSACPTGYHDTRGDGTACAEVDECSSGAVAACGTGATACANTTGSYSCTCDSGYSGTGTTACLDIDECGSTNVCTADFPCENLSPSYTCRGQFEDWPPAYSASAFTVNSDGTVTDSRGGLLWQQTVDANSYAWVDAKAYCAGLSLAGAGWRLPTRAELESIVDDTRFNPAIDPTAFPGTPMVDFWSSSPYVVSSGNAWFIGFDDGSSSQTGPSIANRVRCVR